MELEFTLVYTGNLPVNGSKIEKQEIRRQFHPQLKELWEQSPFGALHPPPQSLTTQIGNFRFLPLVTKAREEVAELHITMLRPEPPGQIISQGGDIDNRLKTLLDSFRMPQVDEIPKNDAPQPGEDPLFCLLEDDHLITSLSVSTDRLLEPGKLKSFVWLLIRVRIKQIQHIGSNMIVRIGGF